ncbi:hypothetical protein FNH05_16960 [Amycolatopsis rhizosphaerae]|uniref:Uncharacterized protein n=1 Tax=Amycolatopsis rhizosphaerae TaxID=2053003 RepID=A0A558CL18_9PSEU|nr:hypothetical protein [Amycolatopsis rhizosphaerae]TVT49444.1 hypothetical protein FNH05_16960 [Amycolatopsis rhizosphaerae]
MTRTEQEYRELRRLPRDERRGWVHTTFPGGAPPQWWFAMVESAELGVSPLRAFSADQCRENFDFAVSLLELALDERGMTPCHCAYWMVRLAAMALRYRTPIAGLPESVTPDGAARLALSRIPLSREEVLMVAGRRRNDLRQGKDRFYQSGDDLSSLRIQVSDEVRLLQETGRVLHSLEWIADRVVDDWLFGEVRSWLGLRSELEM